MWSPVPSRSCAAKGAISKRVSDVGEWPAVRVWLALIHRLIRLIVSNKSTLFSIEKRPYFLFQTNSMSEFRSLDRWYRDATDAFLRGAGYKEMTYETNRQGNMVART